MTKIYALIVCALVLVCGPGRAIAQTASPNKMLADTSCNMQSLVNYQQARGFYPDEPAEEFLATFPDYKLQHVSITLETRALHLGIQCGAVIGSHMAVTSQVAVVDEATNIHFRQSNRIQASASVENLGIAFGPGIRAKAGSWSFFGGFGAQVYLPATIQVNNLKVEATGDLQIARFAQDHIDLVEREIFQFYLDAQVERCWWSGKICPTLGFAARYSDRRVYLQPDSQGMELLRQTSYIDPKISIANELSKAFWSATLMPGFKLCGHAGCLTTQAHVGVSDNKSAWGGQLSYSRRLR